MKNKLLLTTLGFLAWLSFIPNNKFYIATFVIYGLLLFFFFRFSLLRTIFWVLLLALPFERGLRGWFLTVVPPGPESWMLGYKFYFGLTPKLFFLAAGLLLLLVYPKIKLSPAEGGRSKLLLLFLALALVSAFLAENFFLTLPGLLRLAALVGLYLAGQYCFGNKINRDFFPRLLVIFLLVFGAIGSWQLINQRPLGLFLEDTGVSGAFGYLTTDPGFRLYRVLGLTGHPTFFGSFLSLLLPVGLGMFFANRRRRNFDFWLASGATALGLVALFGTFSRSGWMALFLGLLIFLWQIKAAKIKLLRFRIAAAAIVLGGSFLSLFGPLFFARLETLRNLGNLQGRLSLVWQALLTIKEFPLWGAGLNQFTRVMSERDLSIEARTFLFPVHNTFLLFFSEIGLPAGLAFLAFVIKTVWQTWQKARQDWLTLGVWIGAATFLLNAQFHTLFNLDPTLDLFIVMLAYLGSL